LNAAAAAAGRVDSRLLEKCAYFIELELTLAGPLYGYTQGENEFCQMTLIARFRINQMLYSLAA